MQYKLKGDWDDLDIEDKTYMDVVRELHKLDIDKLINLYVRPMSPEIYEKMLRAIRNS